MAVRWWTLWLGVTLAAATFGRVRAQDGGMPIGSWREALALLRTHQPELERAKAAVEAARAAVDAAAAARLPRFEFGVGAEYGAVRPVYGDDLDLAHHRVFTAGGLIPHASARVAADFSLSAWSLRDGAASGLAAAEAEREAKGNGLRQQLAAALLSLSAAGRVEQRASEGAAAARERLELARRLLALGRADQLDELRFVHDLHEAEASVIEARRAVVLAKAALGEALGVQGEVELAASFDPESVRAASVDRECKRVASLSERPEVAAASFRLEQARRAARTTELQGLPELRVETRYLATHEPSSAVTMEGERQLLHDWSVGVDLVWSIWDGGLRAAELDRRRAEAASWRAAETATARGVVRQVRLAAERMALARDQLRLAQERFEAARATDALTRRAYELGSASALESVDAAGQLRRAAIEVAVRQVELLGAEVVARSWWARCEVE